MQWRSCEFYGESKTLTLELYNKYYKNPKEMINLDKPNLLYINMDNNTTISPFYKAHTNIRDTATVTLESNGFTRQSNKPLEDYIRELSTYKFCISPPGRGIDAHRTWECLMVGTIPICISSPLDSIYRDLPVIIVNNYSVITRTFLEEQYVTIKKNCDVLSLYGDYWKSLIRN
jgi:hypothetical protein